MQRLESIEQDNKIMMWVETGDDVPINQHLLVKALIYFVQQKNMTKYIGSCIVANPLNLKACV